MRKYLLITIFLGLLPAVVQTQTPDDATRDLWDTAFLQKRPEGSKQRRTQAVRYRAVGKKPLPASTSSEPLAVVGVTIWRLRPAKNADDQVVRQLIHDQGEWTP